MAEELEIKLTLAEDDVPRVLQWLTDEAGGKPKTHTLSNCYYDTPDATLNHEHAALRVRQFDAQYIQTLKTKGEFVNGAHRRNEWEWPLPGPSLDADLLRETPLAERINPARLQPVFETNFKRHLVLLHQHGATVECAVDCGTVIAGDRRWPLNEVEFELKVGQPDALLRCARQLANQVPLFLNLVSKAEQGYFLAGLYKPEGVLSESVTVTAVLKALSRDWLTGEVSGETINLVRQLEVFAGEHSLGAECRWLTGALERGQSIPELAVDQRLIKLQLDLLRAQSL